MELQLNFQIIFSKMMDDSLINVYEQQKQTIVILCIGLQFFFVLFVVVYLLCSRENILLIWENANKQNDNKRFIAQKKHEKRDQQQQQKIEHEIKFEPHYFNYKSNTKTVQCNAKPYCKEIEIELFDYLFDFNVYCAAYQKQRNEGFVCG